jgi:hypothetical protein
VLRLALAFLLLLPAAALAEPPGRVVAGVRVDWPLPDYSEHKPGERVTVRVTSERRRVRLSLVRVTLVGNIIKTVAARTLRSGRFSVRLPEREWRAYELRMSVAGRRFSSHILVPGEPCDRVEPRVDAPAYRPGAELALTIRNGGRIPFEVATEGINLEVQDARGEWNEGPAMYPADWTYVPVRLAPGAEYVKRAVLPATLPAGTYRVIVPAHFEPTLCSRYLASENVSGAPFTVS